MFYKYKIVENPLSKLSVNFDQRLTPFCSLGVQQLDLEGMEFE